MLTFGLIKTCLLMFLCKIDSLQNLTSVSLEKPNIDTFASTMCRFFFTSRFKSFREHFFPLTYSSILSLMALRPKLYSLGRSIMFN
ncbi:MAG: hypothetical protein ACTS46_02065 [Candidatus Hodgkinia cicadicola]